MMKKGNLKQKSLLWSQFLIKVFPGKVLLSALRFVLIVSIKESIFHRLCHLKVHIKSATKNYQVIAIKRFTCWIIEYDWRKLETIFEIFEYNLKKVFSLAHAFLQLTFFFELFEKISLELLFLEVLKISDR